MYQYKVLKKYEAVVTESIVLESPRELSTDEVEDLATNYAKEVTIKRTNKVEGIEHMDDISLEVVLD